MIDDLIFVDVLSEMPELIKGVPGVEISGKLELYSSKTKREFIVENNFVDKQAVADFAKYGQNTSGCCIRFTTDAEKIVLVASLRYASSLLKVTVSAASGFDLYEKNKGYYYHKAVFFPNASSKIVGEIVCRKNAEYVLYFPLYDYVEEIKIAAINGSIKPLVNDFSYSRPVAFYGSSITQGASASRAGNVFCNIVSRKLNVEVVNYSVSSFCKGNLSVAETIGKFNYGAIVVDYSRNAFSVHSFELTYDKFYLELRKYHPDIPIVLLTPINLSKQIGYYGFNDVIMKTYNAAIQRGENTIYIDVDSLFNEDEVDFVAVDTVHLSDYGMYVLGEKIAEELRAHLK